MDDYGYFENYYADLILNQNLTADSSSYRKANGNTRLLLGPEYVLLREDILSWKHTHRTHPRRASKILITIGGSDPYNISRELLILLKKPTFSELQVKIIIGPKNRNNLFAAELNPNMEFHVAPKNMPELMAWSDLAITAIGGTCWELAFLGVPFIVFSFSPEQKKIAECLEKLRAAVHFEWKADSSIASFLPLLEQIIASQGTRDEMSSNGRRLIDGKGSSRVLKNILLDEFSFSHVTEEHREMIWMWSNDPVIRSASFSSPTISWQEHISWFNRILKDPKSLFLIVKNRVGEPIGQVRFEEKNAQAIVSVSIIDRFRGFGLGSNIIEAACGKFFRHSNNKLVNAYVKQENKTSIMAFRNAGFKIVGETEVAGNRSFHLQAERII